MDSSFKDDLLHHYTDAELAYYIQGSPRLSSYSKIFLLSANHLAKYCSRDLIEDTCKAMNTAHSLGIRVPIVKRVVEYEDNTYYIMERIDGITLEDAWASLSWFTSLRLAVFLLCSVRLLRSSVSSTAGSLSTGRCRSFWLEDHYGLPAKSTFEDVASFIQFWTNFVSMRQARNGKTLRTNKYTPTTANLFVFTHHDLAPRNLLLDRCGHLWLLDWDIAGWYPSYFEYASMHNFSPQGWSWLTQTRWNLFTWIAAGCWEKERCMLEQIRSKFTRFSAGRRFQLLRDGGPSARPVS
ncbi:hypothetical protein GX50_08857 [[Emmonsia] crescens]|uniref:Aminoglycoside phosphotransferase domain-containing protein n=1 Tax=[Emmonsia] crescens TaxID=73230 RepID=A0A2B7Z593_9EURO|nr:hypothetical protein GX50_08857 [Emmonsia crescens]